jgi:hypothetical protein
MHRTDGSSDDIDLGEARVYTKSIWASALNSGQLVTGAPALS